MDATTIETIPITTERTEKFLNDLNKQSTLITSCTELLKTLTTHFTSLHTTLSRRTQTLNSKFQTLDSLSTQTLSSLALRESEILGRESAARDGIEAAKQSALFGIKENFDNSVYTSSSHVKLSDWLGEFARRMDGPGLLRLIVMKRKESVVPRNFIAAAVMESAVDPPRLVLDAVEEFVRLKREKNGVSNARWACGMLVQGVFPEGRYVGGGEREGGSVFARSIVDGAVRVLEMWRGEEIDGPVEAVTFLQLVAGFGVKERIDEEFLRKIVIEHSGKRDMAKLAIAVGFGHKIGVIIDELAKNEKELDAIYFASEAGLLEKYPAVYFLKSFLKNSKKNTTDILKIGNYSPAAKDEASNVELNSIRSIIKCVEDHKLEHQFPLESLRKRASLLEKMKTEKKKSSTSTPISTKPQTKRAAATQGGGPPVSRSAKAAKYTNNYTSFTHRNPVAVPVTDAQQSPVARYTGPYSYPSQNTYEGYNAKVTHYSSTYSGGLYTPSLALSQQQFSSPSDNVRGASGSYGGSIPLENAGADGVSLGASGSYGNLTTYGLYGLGTPPTQQPGPL